MNELCLFAGAGGGLLATQHLLGHRTVCYVEREPYCIEVLKARIRDGVLDDAPIDDDVRTFDGRPWRGVVDCVSAGFPCQPFSVAGQQKADLDERNLWPATVRIIRDVEPEWCFLENVPGLLSSGHGYFGTILRDLAESGFDVAWKVLSAGEVGAPHLRKRLWIVGRHADCQDEHPQREIRGGEGTNSSGDGHVAHAMRAGCKTRNIDTMGEGQQGTILPDCPSIVDNTQQLGWGAGRNDHREHDGDESGPASEYAGEVADATGSDAQGDGAQSDWVQRGLADESWWATEPAVGRVAHGVAHRVDRLRAIGNGQVPLVAATAFRLLTEDTEP